MKHSEDYDIVISDEKVLIFVLQADENKIDNPKLLYDGGRHATLYKNAQNTLLLDYLAPEIQDILKTAEFIIVAETDENKEKVIRDYKVALRRVELNPFTDGLK